MRKDKEFEFKNDEQYLNGKNIKSFVEFKPSHIIGVSADCGDYELYIVSRLDKSVKQL
jgi:hypothetical protein